MLTDTQLRTLWQQFNVPAWEVWQKSYLGFIEKIRRTSPQELRTPELQRQLWTARDISSIGPGDSQFVKDLYDHPEFVEELSSLRAKTWPPEPEKRAEAFQQEFDRLMAKILTIKERSRPNAKLQRIFAAFFPEDVCCLFNWESIRHASELVLDGRKGPVLFLHVLIRAKLKAVLGAEKNDTECIRRSMFCWWLHEQYNQIKAALPDLVGFQPPAPSPAPPPPPALVLWPFDKQFKGNTFVSQSVNIYFAIVQAALAGLSLDNLVESLASEPLVSGLSRTSLRQVVLRVQGLGFLEQRSGLVYPTEDGQKMLETGDTEVLIERLIERVYGFAQLLRLLQENPKGLSRDQITTELQSAYPQWTSGRMPSQLRRWIRTLGLADKDPQAIWTLTDYGRDWTARLPKELPQAEAATEEDDLDESPKLPLLPLQFPPFATIFKAFQEDPEVKSFVFSSQQLAALHAAWHSDPKKHFIILSGLSGTGKTAVTRCYAKVVCALAKLDMQKHFALVPVSPDWNDPSGLLGYLNALHADPTFQAEPALRLLLRAVQDPAHPYFLILDEMNLARVERYFAPFLSAMESGESLSLHTQEEPVNGVPPRVAWPHNLFIAGTVNMDESTHAFSDKVLDRAFTLEFWDVDLPSYFARRGAARIPEAEDLLIELNRLLYPLRRHFGYRTANELLSFLSVGRSLSPAGNGSLPVYLYDQAIFSKVLPRLRGENSPTLKSTLQELEKLCRTKGLVQCEQKLKSMIALLDATGVTRFWS